MREKLTCRQRRFVDEYVIDFNATQAAARAGYSAHCANEQGARLLANKSVYSAIQAAMSVRRDECVAAADEILLFLTAVMRGSVDGTPVDIKDRLRAAELLGKRYALFTNKTQQEVGLPVIVCDIQ